MWRIAASSNVTIAAMTVLLELTRHEIALRDVQLLLLAVSRERDDLHPVEQRRVNRSELIRHRDEEHARQIDVDLEVVVAERMVLRRVEDFEQSRGRIALKAGGDLVDLVE